MFDYIIVFVLIVLFAKCESATRAISGLDREFSHVKPELICFFLATVAFSIFQVFIFAPDDMLSTFRLNADVVVRVYFLADVLSCIFAGYLLLTLFNLRWHKRVIFTLLMGGYVALLGYLFLLTDLIVSGSLRIGEMLAPVQPGSPWSPAVIVFLIAPLLIWVLVIASAYRRTNSEQTRTRNSLLLYAFILLIAMLIFNLTYTVSLIHCLHGIVFFAMVALMVHRSGFFDIRLYLPGTLEQRLDRHLNHHSQDYINEKSSHDDFMSRVNRELLAYKLKKFEQSTSDTIPIDLLAHSLQMKPSRVLKQLAQFDLVRKRDTER